jgi:hypothetical protein
MARGPRQRRQHPLVDAELKCTITPYGYYLKGRWWTGVSEHWIKKVIWYTKGPIGKRVRGVGMYDWGFQRGEMEGDWEAQVSFFFLLFASFPNLSISSFCLVFDKPITDRSCPFAVQAWLSRTRR